MEVIRENENPAPSLDSPRMPPRMSQADHDYAMAQLQQRMMELEASKQKVFEEMKQGPPKQFPIPQSPQTQVDEDVITKRNAAMILLGYIAQKRLLILISGIASMGALVAYYLAGPIAGFIPFAGYVIYAGNLFLNNEKELKQLKTRFGI